MQAPPIDGKADEALVRYIARMLGLPQRAVSIIRGHASKRKTLQVTATSLTIEQVRDMLNSPPIRPDR